VATYHPDIELVPLGGQPPISGRNAVREWMEPAAFAEQILELLEVHVEGRHAVTLHHTRARGTKSGIEIDFDIWSVWTYDDDGLLVRWEMFPGDAREAALAAAGISPD
jgi:hypothetical protein